MRTAYIDFDGTICHDRYWRSLPSPEYAHVQQLLFVDNRQRVADWMRGQYTAEEINRFVSHETGLDYEYLWRIFVNDCQTMHVSHETLALIAALRQQFHVVLITGNMDSFSRFTVPALNLEQYFDQIVNSWEEGMLKTDHDGRSFLKYLQGNIADAVLLEDSAGSCETFRSLGGTAYQVTKENPVDEYLQQLLRA